MDRVQFISIEDEEPDLVLSFALYDDRLGVKSLILQRTPAYESLLPDYERGVQVSMEGDEEYDNNLLSEIKIENDLVRLSTLRKKYVVDTSRVEKEELEEMIGFIKKMNFDSSFKVKIA